MDKVKILFVGQINNKYEYELRIPDNYDWFTITCTKNEKDGYLCDQIVYNRKILFYGFEYINKQKITKYYDELSKELLLQTFAYELINSLGVNTFTINLLIRLNFSERDIKRKYWKEYLLAKECYILNKHKPENEDYAESLNVIQKRNGEEHLGVCHYNPNNIMLNINPGKTINVVKLTRTKKRLSEQK